MPSGLIHECISKKLIDYININSDEDVNRYYVGSIAADSWKNSISTKEESHFYFDGKTDPDYDYFYNKYKNQMSDPYVKSYLIHLIADYYWYSNDYLSREGIEDYWQQHHALLSLITKKYSIESIDNIKDDFNNPIEEIETNGINETIDFVNGTMNRDINYPLTNYTLDEAIECIDKTIAFVIKEINRLEQK